MALRLSPLLRKIKPKCRHQWRAKSRRRLDKLPIAGL
jgi:hypothetical protein